MELPNEVCQEIGSYLDYESRINYNRVMDFEDRFVRKLDSDSHNAFVKVKILQSYLDRSMRESFERRTINFQRTFHYMAETKDEVLFSIEKLRTHYYERCMYALHVVEDPTRPINYKQRKCIRKYALKVLHKLHIIKVKDIKTRPIVIK